MPELTVAYRTAKIKALADVRPIAIDDADSIIRAFHFDLNCDGKTVVTHTVESIPGVNGASTAETVESTAIANSA